MNLQAKAGPAAVVVGLIVVVGVLVFLFRGVVAGPAHNVSPDNAPDYARQSGMTETGGTPTAPRAPYGPGAAGAGGNTPPGR
jgi:hypothetical protein